MSRVEWFIEGLASDGSRVQRTALIDSPFSVGRNINCHLVLDSQRVSQSHAEFFLENDDPWLRDNGSTNGTFINGVRLEGEQALCESDIIHFADLEYRLGVRSIKPTEITGAQTLVITGDDLHASKFRELRDMLRDGSVEAYMQPIVKFENDGLFAYELLGRGIIDGCLKGPGDLFKMAETLGLADELSVLFRQKGLEAADGIAEDVKLFLNTHPDELLEQDLLLDSLRCMRKDFPSRAIVLEVHESAITNPTALQELSQELKALDVGVAFDDFGVGQARLVELAEAAPEYLKFDVTLIRDLDKAPEKRQNMVKSLVQMTLDLNIMPLAEGIETEEEAKVCADLGFVLAQGYHHGKPVPMSDLKNRA